MNGRELAARMAAQLERTNPMIDNDGGPAFPMPSGQEPRVNETTHFNEGMSLRDWFASNAPPVPALASEAFAAMYRVNEPDGIYWDESTFHSLAVVESRWRYDYADAMLAQRQTKRRIP